MGELTRLEDLWSLSHRQIRRLRMFHDQIPSDLEGEHATALVCVVTGARFYRDLQREFSSVISMLRSPNPPTIGLIHHILGTKRVPRAYSYYRKEPCFRFEQRIAENVIGRPIPVLPTAKDLSSTNGQTIWLHSFDDSDKMMILVHELGHIVYGSIGPGKDGRIPRDRLKAPMHRFLFRTLEEFRINALLPRIGFRRRKFRGFQQKFQQYMIEHFSEIRGGCGTFEQVQDRVLFFDVWGVKMPAFRGVPRPPSVFRAAFEGIQRSMIASMDQGRYVSRDDLVGLIEKIDPQIGLPIFRPDFEAVFEDWQTDSTPEQSQSRSSAVSPPELTIFDLEAFDVSRVSELVDSRPCGAACHIKWGVWSPMEARLRPSHPTHPMSVSMTWHKHRNSGGFPTMSFLHRAHVRAKMGLFTSITPSLQTQKVPTSVRVVIDVTASMATKRKNLPHTPMQASIAMASSLKQATVDARIYGSIDGGRKQNLIWSVEDPSLLHEWGGGGFRTGPLIRLFGLSGQQETIVFFSDTLLGQYIRSGYESFGAGFGGVKALWRHCASCDHSHDCDVDPADPTEKNATTRGINAWSDWADVRADVTSALHEYSDNRVIFVIMEHKSPEARLLVDEITKENKNLRVIWHDGDLSATVRELTWALAS